MLHKHCSQCRGKRNKIHSPCRVHQTVKFFNCCVLRSTHQNINWSGNSVTSLSLTTQDTDRNNRKMTPKCQWWVYLNSKKYKMRKLNSNVQFVVFMLPMEIFNWLELYVSIFIIRLIALKGSIGHWYHCFICGMESTIHLAGFSLKLFYLLWVALKSYSTV